MTKAYHRQLLSCATLRHSPSQLLRHLSRLLSRLLRSPAITLKWPAFVLAGALFGLLAMRSWDAWQEPELEAWHKHAPEETEASDLDRMDWAAYVAAETALLVRIQSRLHVHSSAAARPQSFNRFDTDSPTSPARLTRDWNRSFVLEPSGKPRGVAVLLHGLTDSPFSMRHLAELYRAQGFVALAIRIPGHGTVPGALALTRVDWPEWLAAGRLALREGRRRAGTTLPLHLIGYSNGGALSVKLAADALEDPSLPRVDRIVLVSPMIGVTEFARFSGLAGLPPVLPASSRAAWLDILPEFNPFKYNSFPVNAARQSFLLTRALQLQIARLAATGQLEAMPPVLAFQSVVDATVSTAAVIEGLFRHLPDNGSELVLFDLNRRHVLQPLMRPGTMPAPARLPPPAPRHYAVRFLTNTSPDVAGTVERITDAGTSVETVHETGLSWNALVFSLSHVALPFPVSDSLYGLEPDRREHFGINLGTLVVRGERDVLSVGLPLLMRLQSNPFYPYMAARISAAISDSLAAPPAAASGASVAGAATPQ